MTINFDMFSVIMLYRIMNNANDSLIIIVEAHKKSDRKTKLREKKTQP